MRLGQFTNDAPLTKAAMSFPAPLIHVAVEQAVDGLCAEFRVRCESLTRGKDMLPVARVFSHCLEKQELGFSEIRSL